MRLFRLLKNDWGANSGQFYYSILHDVRSIGEALYMILTTGHGAPIIKLLVYGIYKNGILYSPIFTHILSPLQTVSYNFVASLVLISVSTALNIGPGSPANYTVPRQGVEGTFTHIWSVLLSCRN